MTRQSDNAGPRTATPGNQVPVVHQYGDNSLGFGTDQLHCERLSVRSRQHQFKIRPHRHRGLTQIFLVSHGSGQAVVDGRQTNVQAPAALVIAELCVHDFIWSEDVEGYVLSISHGLLEQLSMEQAASVFLHTRVLQDATAVQELALLLKQLHDEYSTPPDELRAQALLNWVRLSAIRLYRQAREVTEAPGNDTSRGLQWLQRFTSLINRDYALQRTVEDYASELGISAAHLNAICQTHTRRNALSLVHERVIVEACRYLNYTVQPVSSIAYQLGYSDPAYFTRFFRRQMGVSPREYRNSSDSGHMPAAIEEGIKNGAITSNRS